MDWLLSNKEWLFSGIFVALPLAVLGWLFSKRTSSRSQNQKSGALSTNIQAGGDVNVQVVAPNENPESNGR